MRRIFLSIIFIVFTGCGAGMPPGVTPVKDFEIERYLGKWYEVARLDHWFERGQIQGTAEYTLREDGGISVVNRGFLPEKNRWKEGRGKAYFAGSEDEGYLKVSFFWPFYGSYVVFDLDHDNYQWAYVCGSKTKYLWFLSRTPTVSQAAIDRFIQKARSLGFDTDKLIISARE